MAHVRAAVSCVRACGPGAVTWVAAPQAIRGFGGWGYWWRVSIPVGAQISSPANRRAPRRPAVHGLGWLLSGGVTSPPRTRTTSCRSGRHRGQVSSPERQAGRQPCFFFFASLWGSFRVSLIFFILRNEFLWSPFCAFSPFAMILLLTCNFFFWDKLVLHEFDTWPGLILTWSCLANGHGSLVIATTEGVWPHFCAASC